MEKMTRSELQKLQTLNEVEIVTDKQLAGYVIAATQEIEKSITAEDAKIVIEKEVSSFRPIEVYDDVDGHIEKSIVFIRPSQVEWVDKINNRGIYKDTPLNRELCRVGDDIQKGGEGSRGGRVIGHTKSGKPIYESMSGKDHKDFSIEDHRDATRVHLSEAKKHEGRDDVKARAHWNEAWKHDRVGNRKEIQGETKKEKSIKEDGDGNNIEKGKPAVTGEIREWGGKKYKKQANGKWLEVSESGRTKREHERFHKEAEDDKKKPSNKGEINQTAISETSEYHKRVSSKLSDKEHSDEEVGLGKKEEKGDRFEHKGITIHVGRDTSGGQNTLTYKAPEISNKTFWNKSALIKLIDENVTEDYKGGEEVGLGDGDKKSGGETFKLKADMPYMVSLANLRGKELKSKGTKEVSFATGKQTYHVFDVDGEEVEVPERFLDKVSEKKETKK